MTGFQCLVVTVGLLVAAIPSGSTLQSQPAALEVAPTGWGEASTADVDRLLQNVSFHLVQHFPDFDLPGIIVRPRGGPMMLHQRGADGRLVMRLNTRDKFWAQYAFQFSHELCHVLARFDEDPTGNLWFEESICQAASWFVLLRMGESWVDAPPYPNWSRYAPALTRYAEAEKERCRPAEGFELAAWYRAHEGALVADPENRDLNGLVASVLLPMFEAEPEHWQAVSYLNVGQPSGPQSFADYLGDWHANSPPRHRPFIREIARKFGVSLDA